MPCTNHKVGAVDNVVRRISRELFSCSRYSLSPERRHQDRRELICIQHARWELPYRYTLSHFAISTISLTVNREPNKDTMRRWISLSYVSTSDGQYIFSVMRIPPDYSKFYSVKQKIVCSDAVVDARDLSLARVNMCVCVTVCVCYWIEIYKLVISYPSQMFAIHLLDWIYYSIKRLN